MCHSSRQKAFTLVELMTVVGLVAILVVVAIASTADVYHRNNLFSEMVILKNAVLKTRIRAVENTANARFSFENGLILAELDKNHNGVYGEDFTELIVGDEPGTGLEIGTKRVETLQVTDNVGWPICHPSGFCIQQRSAGFTTIDGDAFIIGPTGIVRDPQTNAPTDCTMFFSYRSEGQDKMQALVHVTTLGEVYTALREEGQNDWTWQ